jgi:hypothetical protein
LIFFAVYLLLFTVLIYRNGFFGIFKDEHVSKKIYAGAFVFKASAVLVFYWIYERYYGGIQSLDAGKFFHDAQAFNHIAYDKPIEFLKLVLGFQNETEGSYCYEQLLKKTHQWDNGIIRSFWLNDNRVLIRLHGVLHFISFNSYFAHALFCCFYSFIGIQLIYKALKSFFSEKEKWVLLCFVAFPSLYLFTGALLKESLTFLCIGVILFSWKKISERNNKWICVNLIALFLALVLKPYVLLPIWLFFGLFHLLPSRLSTLNFSLSLAILLFLGGFSLNMILVKYKDKSLTELFSSRQIQFNAVAKGGIFLANDSVFLRLENDSALIQKTDTHQENNICIVRGAAYTYWKNNNDKDTLYCNYNSDSVSTYHEMFRIAPSKNNLPIPAINNNWKQFIINAPVVLLYVCFHPLFYNAHGALELMVSLENILLLITCVILLFGFRKYPQKKLLVSLIFLCVLLFVLIGYTSPNLGAIVRYRCLLLPILFCLPLALPKLLKKRL